MKFFEAVGQLTSTITSLITHLLPPHRKIDKSHPSAASPRGAKGRITARKRKSFGGFSKENSFGSSSSSANVKKDRSFVKARRSRKFKFDSFKEDESVSNEEGMEEKITNEVIPSGTLRLKFDPVFKYENGLEISMIEQESVIN